MLSFYFTKVNFKGYCALALMLILFPFVISAQSLKDSKQDNANKTDKNISADSLTQRPPVQFVFYERAPRFPGGEKALIKYIRKHLRYPSTARKNHIKGTVDVQFLVNIDGTIQNVKAVGREKGYGLDKEAVRLVKEMPRWIPGSQSGKKIPVQYNLPIRF